MSIGEVLSRALSDTLMGMGTVFIILVLICLVISLFKYIPKGKNEHRTVTEKTQARESGAINKPAGDMIISEGAEEDDEEEIVAVILAAIMMAKQKEKLILDVASDGSFVEPDYVVRSIRRRR